MNNTDLDRTRKTKQRTRRMAWLALLLLMLLVLFAVLTPVWLIMPFKAQTTRSLAVSYTLRRWSPLLSLVGALIVFALTVCLWRGARWFGKIALAVALALVCASAWLARQNHFEWMFNPLGRPTYAKVTEANFVADSDRVMAVEIGGEAVAYPIRQMAYHHVVADVVGGTPIIATY